LKIAPNPARHAIFGALKQQRYFKDTAMVALNAGEIERFMAALPLPLRLQNGAGGTIALSSSRCYSLACVCRKSLGCWSMKSAYRPNWTVSHKIELPHSEAFHQLRAHDDPPATSGQG
jgi:hypothetical protein